MIILDEELQGLGLEAAISRWYRGAILQMRPGSVIKDEAIPALLRRFCHNQSHGFLETAATLCALLFGLFQLSADQASEMPELLRRLLRFPEFEAGSNGESRVS